MSARQKLDALDLRSTINILSSSAQDAEDEGERRAARTLRDLMSVCVLRLEELKARPS